MARFCRAAHRCQQSPDDRRLVVFDLANHWCRRRRGVTFPSAASLRPRPWPPGRGHSHFNQPYPPKTIEGVLSRGVVSRLGGNLGQTCQCWS
jgi:hypothetical protein